MPIYLGNDLVTLADNSNHSLRVGYTSEPIEYKAVEWIKATSNYAYIDTGIKASSKVDLEITAKFNLSSLTMCAIGARTSPFSSGGKDITWATPALFYQEKGYSVSASMQSNKIYHLKTEGSKMINADTGVVLVNLGTVPTWEIDKPIYICCLNNNGNADRLFNGEIYSAKLYVEGNLVRDFIPCYRKSDGVIGMYDLIEHKFYEKQGNGTMEKGEDK